MALEVTREMGEATLAPNEKAMWEALNCPDLEVDMTAKLGRELRKLRRRKQWPPGTEIRSRKASGLMQPLLEALHPEVVHALFSAMMSARVERDLLMKAAADLLAANTADEDEDEDDTYDEAAVRLAHLIDDVRERNEL